jgi:hypothetical protein
MTDPEVLAELLRERFGPVDGLRSERHDGAAARSERRRPARPGPRITPEAAVDERLGRRSA